MQSSQSSVEEEAKQGSDILYTHCTLQCYTVSYSMPLFNIAMEMSIKLWFGNLAGTQIDISVADPGMLERGFHWY